MRKMENEQIIRMLKSVLERMTTTYGSDHQDTLKLKRVIADFEAKEILKAKPWKIKNQTTAQRKLKDRDRWQYFICYFLLLG